MKWLECLQSLQRADALELSSEKDERGEVRPVLVLAQVQDPEARRAQDTFRAMLGLEGSSLRFALTAGKGGTAEIQVRTRSLMGVLYFLAQSVETPERDIRENRVLITRNADGTPYDWSRLMGRLFKVRCQAAEPKDAFLKVRHRGSWFYLSDQDPYTKQTWAFLNALFMLQSAETKGRSPLLTLSAGG